MKTASERLEILRNQQKLSNTIYRPLFYRPGLESDRQKFSELLQLPGISVTDYISSQIGEYIKLMHPDRRFSTDELESLTKRHIGNTRMEDYGVWVFYPWSGRLVHILDEAEFIEVRTSRNQYKITREERALLATKKIGVVGLSVGQSVSVTMAMERLFGELRLADFDILELTNLNRIRTGIHNLGLPKVYSVAREIAEIDPFLKVTCFTDGLTEENMHAFFTGGGLLDLMVEESDGFDIKILSRYKARELKVPVVMEASDRCMVDVERFDLEPDRPILHGIVHQLDVAKLKSLNTNEEKIPYMLDVLGLETSSARLRASMLEMQHTITTWPQLASAVTMGGGITADVSRRLLLNQFTESGRYYVDIDELIGNKGAKEPLRYKKVDEPSANVLEPSKMKQEALQYTKGTPSDIETTHLEKVVEAALMAPSYGNKQPWKWLSLEKRLFLFYDKHSARGINDAAGQNALVSLGAAIENAVSSAGDLGYEALVELSDAADDGQPSAVITFRKSADGHKTGALAAYIPLRHTNRKPGSGKIISQDVIAELNGLTKDVEGGALNMITDPQKIAELGDIVGRIEQMRLLNPAAHHDYFKNELRWKGDGVVADGIDVETLEISPAALTSLELIADPAVSALIGSWEKGGVFSKMTSRTVATSGAIGLITMNGRAKTDLINGGRLAEKVWLTTTKYNLAFQPICLSLSFLKIIDNQNKDHSLSLKDFSELKDLKVQFSLIFSELKQSEAVFLFRLSDADKPQIRSLRKPLSEVYFKS